MADSEVPVAESPVKQASSGFSVPVMILIAMLAAGLTELAHLSFSTESNTRVLCIDLPKYIRQLEEGMRSGKLSAKQADQALADFDAYLDKVTAPTDVVITSDVCIRGATTLELPRLSVDLALGGEGQGR